MTSHRTGRRVRRVPAALTVVCAAALAAATLAATAGPVSAGVPTKAGKADSTAASSPNKDDDAIKDPCEALNYTDHSAENGSPKENDQGTPCGPVPVVVPAPAVLPRQPATVASETDLLACGETITTDNKGILPDVSVTRLDDADATGGECEPFHYELKSIPDGLRFIKPTGYPLSQFFVEAAWYRSPDEVDEAPIVDFEAVKGGYSVPVPECPAKLRDSSGEVVGATVPSGATREQVAAILAGLGIVDQDGSPSVWNPEDNGLTQYACVAETTMDFEPWAPGGPRYLVHQRMYLLGDVIFRH